MSFDLVLIMGTGIFRDRLARLRSQSCATVVSILVFSHLLISLMSEKDFGWTGMITDVWIVNFIPLITLDRDLTFAFSFKAVLRNKK